MDCRDRGKPSPQCAEFVLGSVSGFRDTMFGPLTVSGNQAGISFTVSSSSDLVYVAPTEFLTPISVPLVVNAKDIRPGKYPITLRVVSQRALDSPVTVPIIVNVQSEVRALVSAASFSPGGVSPGEIITLFGIGIGPDSLMSADLARSELARNLGDFKYLVDGNPASILYTSYRQASIIIPYAVTGRSRVVLQFESPRGELSGPVTVHVLPSRPGLFTANASGSGRVAALNQNFSLNSESNPAARGEVVQLFTTWSRVRTHADQHEGPRRCAHWVRCANHPHSRR